MKLFDFGGKCSNCQEEDNWIILERFHDKNSTWEEFKLKCVTFIYADEEGERMIECGNLKEVIKPW